MPAVSLPVDPHRDPRRRADPLELEESGAWPLSPKPWDGGQGIERRGRRGVVPAHRQDRAECLGGGAESEEEEAPLGAARVDDRDAPVERAGRRSQGNLHLVEALEIKAAAERLLEAIPAEDAAVERGLTRV